MECVNAVFSLKIILQCRCEHGIDSFAIFVDLIKAHDSVRHDIASAALVKMGPPPMYVEWLETLCGDFNVVLKLAKKEINIRHGCGVRQGDNLAPTLFKLVLQLVAEDILRTFRENRIDMLEIMCNKDPTGVLKLHKYSYLQSMITKIISLFTHVDDGAATFNNREDSIKGCNTICNMMAK